MAVIQVKRGDIHYANLDPVVGREIGKTRPVLVIQNDIGNMYSPTTIVAVITEYSEKKASYPICIATKKKKNGLKKESVVNLAQIRTIDKKRLTTPKLGSLSKDTMKKVDDALKNSLALSLFSTP
jgi:mRNA interferase MazF